MDCKSIESTNFSAKMRLHSFPKQELKKWNKVAELFERRTDKYPHDELVLTKGLSDEGFLMAYFSIDKKQYLAALEYSPRKRAYANLFNLPELHIAILLSRMCSCIRQGAAIKEQTLKSIEEIAEQFPEKERKSVIKEISGVIDRKITSIVEKDIKSSKSLRKFNYLG